MRVVTFDYSGLGSRPGRELTIPYRSRGTPRIWLTPWNSTRSSWRRSLGGLAAQMFVAHTADVSHAVLIGTGPPGPLVKTGRTTLLRHCADSGKHVRGSADPVLRATSPASRAAARLSIDRIAGRRANRRCLFRSSSLPQRSAARPRNPISPPTQCWRRSRRRPLPICTSAETTTSRFRWRTGTRSTGNSPTCSCSRSLWLDTRRNMNPVAQAPERIATFVHARTSPPASSSTAEPRTRAHNEVRPRPTRSTLASGQAGPASQNPRAEPTSKQGCLDG